MVSKTSIVTLLICAASSNAFSVDSNNSNRRSFLTDIATATTAVAGIASIGASPALAAPEIVNLSSGIKYAITRPTEKGKYPNMGDIVFVEYTGYLANGQVCYLKKRKPTSAVDNYYWLLQRNTPVLYLCKNCNLSTTIAHIFILFARSLMQPMQKENRMVSCGNLAKRQLSQVLTK